MQRLIVLQSISSNSPEEGRYWRADLHLRTNTFIMSRQWLIGELSFLVAGLRRRLVNKNSGEMDRMSTASVVLQVSERLSASEREQESKMPRAVRYLFDDSAC